MSDHHAIEAAIDKKMRLEAEIERLKEEREKMRGLLRRVSSRDDPGLLFSDSSQALYEEIEIILQATPGGPDAHLTP